ncbi:unnamed protein product [Cylicocyclus nassatus]|uniref:CUB-like domain-containing protein n=1 Tax=Cylicocyclus nassatus TaxID=53992 RepID=A0AA36H3Q8_CYLNA|nr:unnamed protein product [Cylicocyclus nassatus]
MAALSTSNIELMILPALIILSFTSGTLAQWAACASGTVAIAVNASDTIYALKNDSGVIPLLPGTQCSFQIAPLPFTVAFISVSGSNFTNSTVVAYYEGNTANPIYVNDSNPIEFTFPASAAPYLVMVRRLPTESPATFAMKIRGEEVSPGDMTYGISSNATLRILPGSYKTFSSTFYTPDGYKVGLMVDYYTNSTTMPMNEPLNLLRNLIFFSNTSYLATAAAIYTTRNGVFPTGQQYLTMFDKINTTDKVNLIAFAYREPFNSLWSAYSFSDMRESDFNLTLTAGSPFAAKVVSKIGDSANGVIDDIVWMSARSLEIYEGVPEINATSTTGKLVTVLNSTNTNATANNTVKLPSSVYTFVNRGGSMYISLNMTTSGDKGSSAVYLNILLGLLALVLLPLY